MDFEEIKIGNFILTKGGNYFEIVAIKGGFLKSCPYQDWIPNLNKLEKMK